MKALTKTRWILFTSYGWLIGILVVVGLAMLGEVIFKTGDESGGQAIVGVGMGAGIGLMQWLVLRHHISVVKWFLFYVVGFTFSFLMLDVVVSLTELTPEVLLPFATVLGALVSAALQHQFILKKLFPKFRSHFKRIAFTNCEIFFRQGTFGFNVWEISDESSDSFFILL